MSRFLPSLARFLWLSRVINRNNGFSCALTMFSYITSYKALIVRSIYFWNLRIFLIFMRRILWIWPIPKGHRWFSAFSWTWIRSWLFIWVISIFFQWVSWESAGSNIFLMSILNTVLSKCFKAFLDYVDVAHIFSIVMFSLLICSRRKHVYMGVHYKLFGGLVEQTRVILGIYVVCEVYSTCIFSLRWTKWTLSSLLISIGKCSLA